jgi:UDP-N-acetylmuramate: L-alanyl-gamma-D-glutamyl-meso-diaminopimelate ligase
VDAIVEHVKACAMRGDVVAVLSNGGFGGIHDKLLAALV